MLRRSAIKRIIMSTIALSILLMLCLFPKKDDLSIPEEVIYVEELTMPIYVLDQNNYVARTSIIKDDKDIIPYIINALTIKSNISAYLPSGFTALIPQNTHLLDYTLEDGLLKLNFSKEFLNLVKENEEKTVEAIIYSLCELENVNKVMIFIEGNILEKLPNSNKVLPSILDKNFGINKEYNFNNIKDTSKTTIYYMGKYNDNLYYIPITKISSEKIEPVEIIVSELKQTPVYESNLISYLNASYELADYQILEDSITLSFNNEQIASLSEDTITEKVKYSLSLSIRDTYDISDIYININ